jgi:CheY-like chemotaxis protein
LIVDDVPDVREIVVGVLSEIGYRVHEAANGEEALKEIERIDLDLVIIDFAMPGSNGAEVARTVRRLKPNLRIMFASGFSDSSALEEAIGTAALLHKPFPPIELAAAVRSALAR